MNVYDFDKTIYSRDCTAEYVLWQLRRRPGALIARLPTVLGAAARLPGGGNREKALFKEALFSFVVGRDCEAELFWDARIGGVREWYFALHRPDDLVISASPRFLVSPACARLGITRLIATEYDPLSGKISGTNCSGAEKARRFALEYPGERIDDFYSDSLGDAPLALLARRAFLIRSGKPVNWPLNER